MPHRIKYARERLVIARMLLTVFRSFGDAYLGVSHYGSVADDLLLICAIYVGQVEKRPMTVGKLADYAGMKRTTVGSKLKAFRLAGLVELKDGLPALTIEPLNSPVMVNLVLEIRQHIVTAASKLTKTDT